MSAEEPAEPASQCFDCGYEAPAGSDAWDAADHPSLGRLTRCPACGSTDVHSRG